MELDELLELNPGHFSNLSAMIKQKIEGRMPKVRLDINAIIDTNSDSIEDIELILDNLLKYIPFGYGESEFNKLNSYYFIIDKENSKIYSNFYSEITKESS